MCVVKAERDTGEVHCLHDYVIYKSDLQCSWPDIMLIHDETSAVCFTSSLISPIKPTCLPVQLCPFLLRFFFFHPAFTTLYEFQPPPSGSFEITHKDAPQSVGLLWTSDQPVAETHTTLTTDKQQCPRRDSNPQSQQAIGRRHAP